jgi:hypothetical protein
VEEFLGALPRKRGDHDATLAVVHRDLPEDQEHALRSDPLTGGWTFLGEAHEQPASPEQRAIITVLGEAIEPMTSGEIADILSKKPGVIRFLLWKMEQAGLVVRVTTGRYALPQQDHTPPHTPTTNNTNKTNSANTTNSANSVSVSETPEVLALLAGVI